MLSQFMAYFVYIFGADTMVFDLLIIGGFSLRQ
jgi:hypothetical protein